MYRLQQTINEVTNQYLEDTFAIEIHSQHLRELGLDPRCGSIMVSTQYNYVASRLPSRIEYYGGWEYINPSYTMDAGSYRFYDGDAERVADVIDTVNSRLESGWTYNVTNGFVPPVVEEAQDDQEGQ